MPRQPRTSEDLVDGWGALRLPSPRRPRDTFALLSLLGRHNSLDTLLGRTDLETMTPSDVSFAALDRAPESARRLRRGGSYNGRTDFAAMLRGAEFQQRSPGLFLNAFAEKSRLVFIHLPKCAGSDLEMQVAPRFVSIPEALRSTEWISTDKLLRTLGGYANMARFMDTIFYYGHIDFEALRLEIGVRAGDRFFTVLRDPIELMLSNANYLVHRITTDPERRRPDTRHWVSLLGESAIPADLRGEAGLSLAEQVLRDPRLVPPNPMCAYLGAGRADQALNNLAVFDFEVTDIARYERWLRERWNVPRSPRFNRSKPLLSRQNSGRHLDYMMHMTEQDRRLYDQVARALDAAGTASIFGSMLG